MEQPDVLLRRKADQLLSDVISLNILLNLEVPDHIKARGLEILQDSVEKIYNFIPDSIFHTENEHRNPDHSSLSEKELTNNIFYVDSDHYNALSRRTAEFNINYYLSNINVMGQINSTIYT
ncbi:hypothetical protein [Lederbergia citri]|uniref:Uncharacterized protein n=1 Tax=Lederbergia citri TaxID=2833580 RepID=A0A942TGD9_9BACI|nr:hypothetical protein [Lederbergia citri]MBS4195644.1 hypothetical protein [Lederbergia citri]